MGLKEHLPSIFRGNGQQAIDGHEITINERTGAQRVDNFDAALKLFRRAERGSIIDIGYVNEDGASTSRGVIHGYIESPAVEDGSISQTDDQTSQ